MKKYLVLLLLLFSCEYLIANDYQIQYLNTNNGLSQSDVNAIIQSQDGYIWLTTNDGINRSDGVEIKSYHINLPNSNNYQIYRDIAEDNFGRLWIAAFSSVIIYDPNTLVSKKVELPTADVISNINLVKDNKGDIWISRQSSLSRFTPIIGDEFYTTNNTITLNNSIIDVYSSQEDLYVCTTRGVNHLRDGQMISTNSLRLNRISTTPHGLIGINNKGVYFKSNSENDFNLIHSDNTCVSIYFSQKTIYLGTSSGLYRAKYNARENSFNKFIKTDLGGNFEIKNITSDKNNQLWLGTNRNGAIIFNPTQSNFSHIKIANKSFDNKVNSIHIDNKSRTWLGGYSSGAVYFDRLDTNFKRPKFIKPIAGGNKVRSIVSLGENVFISTNSLIKLSFSDNKVEQQAIDIPCHYTQALTQLLASEDNKKLYVATFNSGLYYYDLEQDKVVNTNIFSNRNIKRLNLDDDRVVLRSLAFAKNGDLWIGSSEGIIIISKESINNGTFTPNLVKLLPEEKSYISPIFFDNQDNVWIGTFGTGLFKCSLESEGKINHITQFNTSNGLPNNTIKSIEQDKAGNIWVSTNRGLAQIKDQDQTIITYDVADGLQDMEFGDLSSFSKENGELLFGGVNGVNIFNPVKIKADTTAPNLVIDEFTLFNTVIRPGEEHQGNQILSQSINKTSSITLKYFQNTFTFSFAGIHYINAKQNKYLYKLEGFDNDWITATALNRRSSYTNIPSGNYTFKVKSSNPDGAWSNVREIKVRVLKPWWRTHLAIILYVLMCLAAIIIIYYYVHKAQQDKIRLKIIRLKREKLAAIAQMQVDFFTNISHEFRTPLTLIIAPIKQLMEQRELNQEKVEKLHSYINNNAQILMRLTNQLLDYAKHEQGELKLNREPIELVEYLSLITAQFSSVADEKDINIKFETTLSQASISCDRTMLDHILYNIINNAFKFTPTSGEITISLESKEQDIIIGIKDNGSGMDIELQKHVFERFKQGTTGKGGTGIGLAFTKTLVNLNMGEINVESTLGKGTKFSMEFPVVENKNIEIKTKQIDITPKKSEQKILEDFSAKSRMLIVEDNISILNLLKDYFEKKYTVDTATNGEQGLISCRENQPDIIISDVIMPVMDGIEMCNILKQDSEISHIPIIILTAKTTPESQIQGYESGADAYLTKPFENKVLEALCESTLKNRESSRKKFQSSLDINTEQLTTTATDRKFLDKCIEITTKNLDNSEFTAAKFAEEMGTSQYLMNKKLKSLTGLSANGFVTNARLKTAAQLLIQSQLTINEIAFKVGYNSIDIFRPAFVQQFAVTPSQYRKRG